MRAGIRVRVGLRAGMRPEDGGKGADESEASSECRGDGGDGVRV